MKRIIAIFLALGMGLMIVGCTESTEQDVYDEFSDTSVNFMTATADQMTPPLLLQALKIGGYWVEEGVNTDGEEYFEYLEDCSIVSAVYKIRRANANCLELGKVFFRKFQSIEWAEEYCEGMLDEVQGSGSTITQPNSTCGQKYIIGYSSEHHYEGDVYILSRYEDMVLLAMIDVNDLLEFNRPYDLYINKVFENLGY